MQTGNGIISPISWPLIKKLILQKVSNFYNGVQNWCWKEEMDLSNRKWNCFSYFLTTDQTTSFTKCFWILSTRLKLDLKIGNGIIQTGNGIISISWPQIKKTLLQKFSNFYQWVQNWKMENGIIQRGNGINSPISWPPIKKLLLQNVSNIYQQVQNCFCNQEIESFKQQMELFLLFPELQSKTSFTKCF